MKHFPRIKSTWKRIYITKKLRVSLNTLLCFSIYIAYIMVTATQKNGGRGHTMNRCHCHTKNMGYCHTLNRVHCSRRNGGTIKQGKGFTVSRWVSEWLLFRANWAIFQLYYGKNKLPLLKWWRCPLCSKPTRLIKYL